MKEKIAIFLGAGASAAEGAPIQANLFRDYFTMINARPTPRASHEKAIADFFSVLWDIDVSTNSGEVIFPTFEEALGILDLADLNNQSFKQFPILNFNSDSGKVSQLRMFLVFLMADILKEKLKQRGEQHRKMVINLHESQKIRDVFFITTNYDILCDNALLEFWEIRHQKVDYGVDFVNFGEDIFPKPYDEGTKLFKIHGSLNWLYCPTCNNLRLTPYQKGVSELMTNPEHASCSRCQTFYSPIIVPPTFYKNLSNIFLGSVWNKTEASLLDAEHLIFCGYSFPDADIHIKYMLKRAQKNRISGKPFKVSVVNNYKGKPASTKKEEEYRFKRFFGNAVNYTNYSFEQFSDNPGLLIG